MFSDDDKPPEARQTSAPVRLRSHPPRGPFGTARAILTQLGDRAMRRLTEGSAPNPPHPGFEMRRTWAEPAPWSEEESDVELLNAGLAELATQSAGAPDEEGDKALYLVGLRELEACGAGEVVMRGSPADLRQRRAIPPSFAVSDERQALWARLTERFNSAASSDDERQALWARLTERFNSAASSDDEPEEMVGASDWPALQDKLKERFTKTGSFAEPKLKAPSPPPPPTLLAGGLGAGCTNPGCRQPGCADPDCIDGRPVPPEDEVKVPRRAKKAAKADSVSSGEAAPEERHTRAVLALVSAEPRGAAKKTPIDPIDAADLETCRAALKAVRDAVYGVSPDDLDEWAPGVSAMTTVWLPAAPMAFNRTAEVHGALAEYGLDVHAENEPLVAFAQASGILLVGLDDLDLPDDGGGEE